MRLGALLVAALTVKLTHALASARIPYLDLVQPLREAARQPCFEDIDSRPN